MRMFDDVAALDATGQAELVRRGAVQAVELVDVAIERIERVNPALNAVTTTMYDEAIQAVAAPLPEGPFTGVPFLLKDFLAEYAGARITNSSDFLGDFVPGEDTELVKRYKAAGLVAVGKTNTPEMAIGVTTEPRRFGPTRNPWDTERTPGGSSGGSAAAVAAGVRAHGPRQRRGGVDPHTGIPAAVCSGSAPLADGIPWARTSATSSAGMVSEHALTRSVRDSAALLDATAGPDAGDPYPAWPHERPFADEVGADPGTLRIGFTTETPLGDDLHPDCAAAVKDAAALCQQLGHDVEEASPSFDAELMWQSATKALGVGTAWSIRSWARRLGREPTKDEIEPFVWAYSQRASRISAPEYLLAVQDMQRLTRGHRPLLRRLRRVADPHPRAAARAPGHFRVRRRGPIRAAPAHGRLLALHLHSQRHRPARHVRAPLLERRQPAHRLPLRGPSGRRGGPCSGLPPSWRRPGRGPTADRPYLRDARQQQQAAESYRRSGHDRERARALLFDHTGRPRGSRDQGRAPWRRPAATQPRHLGEHKPRQGQHRLGPEDRGRPGSAGQACGAGGHRPGGLAPRCSRAARRGLPYPVGGQRWAGVLFDLRVRTGGALAGPSRPRRELPGAQRLHGPPVIRRGPPLAARRPLLRPGVRPLRRHHDPRRRRRPDRDQQGRVYRPVDDGRGPGVAGPRDRQALRPCRRRAQPQRNLHTPLRAVPMRRRALAQPRHRPRRPFLGPLLPGRPAWTR